MALLKDLVKVMKRLGCDNGFTNSSVIEWEGHPGKEEKTGIKICLRAKALFSYKCKFYKIGVKLEDEVNGYIDLLL